MPGTMTTTTTACDGVHVHALADEAPVASVAPVASPAWRRIAVRVALAALVLGGLALLVPRLGEVGDALALLGDGSPLWIVAGVLGAVAMHAAYVALFYGVLGEDRRRVGPRAATEIVLAGLAANRVVSAGGAGAVALTAWALRRRGLSVARVAECSVATIVVTYVPYVAAIALAGLWLAVVDGGGAPTGMTLAAAAAATAVLAVAGALVLLGTRLSGRLARVGMSLRRGGAALDLRGTALPAALAYWVAQLVVLWAAFHALGVDPPPVAILVQAFFLGMLGNLIPSPGGVGGVEGGMVAALVALGCAAAPALAAVVVYRLLTNWLPLLPCLIASVRLRRTMAGWATAA